MLVLNRNSSIIQDYKIKPMDTLDIIQFAIIGIVMCGFILIMMCGACLYCWNKNVVNNRVSVNNEEKVEFIEKQKEEMTFIGKIKI